MYSLSTLDPLAGQEDNQDLYNAGNAFGWLYRGNKQAALNHLLSGRLYLSKSGWLLLSVPNALVRGVYDAMNTPGAELPTPGVWGIDGSKDSLNAHISVMTADEVKQIGADKINERGHMFGYALGSMKEIEPGGSNPLSRVWALQVNAPALAALRKSYGLTPLLNDDHAFHITVAVRRKKVLQNNSVSKFNGETSRGALKAASDAENKPSNVLSRSGQKDLLRGGEADNIPDREIDPSSLAEGARHEHEHTDNAQVAKEIAKDHLSEEPRYYEKIKGLEKESAKSRIIDELLTAKRHSDNKRYGHKTQILRRLMEQSPQDWAVDDSAPKFPGITHTPTKFQFHTDRTAIPTGVKAASVYGTAAQSVLLNHRRPPVYDPAQSVFENIQSQLSAIKSRGDFMMQAQRNNQNYQAAIDPNYRHQLALQAFRGTMPGPALFDQMIETYGDGALGAMANMGRPQA